MEEMSVMAEGHNVKEVIPLDNDCETVHQHLEGMSHLIHSSVHNNMNDLHSVLLYTTALNHF